MDYLHRNLQFISHDIEKVITFLYKSYINPNFDKNILTNICQLHHTLTLFDKSKNQKRKKKKKPIDIKSTFVLVSSIQTLKEKRRICCLKRREGGERTLN